MQPGRATLRADAKRRSVAAENGVIDDLPAAHDLRGPWPEIRL
jgi:hypothetical protein